MKKIKLLILIFFLSTASGYAQQNVVEGTVKDISGQPLPGATVGIVKTKKGTTTDFEGKFRIAASEGEILEISFISFITAKITVGKNKSYTIALKEDLSTLDEVVVVGYGVQKKVNLTGSVATVNFKENINQPVTNSGQLLYGRFSGVQLSQSSGNPDADGSSIVIRGIGTFGNSTPLVVIDNIQYDNLAAFNNLAPSDIESITVLKDASASAIYGARGANGVVLVTTRKGKADKFEVSANSFYGVQQATVVPDFLNSLDYSTLINEKFRNNDGPGFIPRYTPAQVEAIRTVSLPDQFANTSWANKLLQPAAIQNHNFSFSGGNKKSTYRLSLGYLNQDAIIKSKFKSERYNLSFNLNSDLKDWLSLSFVTNTFWKRNEGPTGGQNAVSGDNGIIYLFQRTAPTIPAYYSNGEYGIVDGGWNNSNPSFLTVNPLRRGFLGNYVSDNINTSQRLGLTFKFTDALTFETSGSANFIYSNVSDFSPTATIRSYDGQIVQLNLLNNLSNSTNLEYRLLTENILRYDKTVNKVHNFGALVGHSVSNLRNDGFSGSAGGFPTNNLEEFNAGGIINQAVSGDAYEEVTQSYFSRFNYNYNEKYLVEFNLRRDGSSKFGTNLYGNFPSASAGWNISKEKFMQNISFVSNFKLRASWGISGNDRISNYIPYQAFNPGPDYVLGNNVVQGGVAITNLANPNIRWEQTEQYDLGLDLSLFKNKIEIIADYFKRNSKDILYTNFPIPKTLGVANLGAQNAASMINEGIELGLNWRGKIGVSKFSLGGNFTKFLNNGVTGLGDGGEKTISSTDIIQIGSPFKSYYGLQAIGIFQTAAEVTNSPRQYGNIRTAPGDIKYADVSGPNGVPDGVVNDADRTIIGNPNPDLLINLNGSWEYKDFDFNFLFQGVSGVDRLLMGNGNLPFADDRSNALSYWINRWTVENPSADLPRVGGQNNTNVSSFYIQDTSYLRLKSIEIGYSLPSSLLKRLDINKLRFFLGAQNLLTFTNLKHFDPEGANGSQSNRNVPLYKTVTFGLNLKL
jgi:TonB-linked SusC/RagA family outer membrane protein